ncbi:MAG TPA: type II toxin-antitoxin system RelE/ParE family toxin [Stellaceae bacterium]|nr:type II toxin-antitoxin system RelE/ParE family toxin [Stellaceae bacterium]
MTTRVFRSPRAGVEIEEIAAYLSEYSLPATRRFLDALESAQQLLSEFPNAGAAGLSPGTRRLIVGDYILSYRVRAGDVEIFAVRHARRRDARQ